MRRGCEDRGSAGVVSPLGRMRHGVQESPSEKPSIGSSVHFGRGAVVRSGSESMNSSLDSGWGWRTTGSGNLVLFCFNIYLSSMSDYACIFK